MGTDGADGAAAHIDGPAGSSARRPQVDDELSAAVGAPRRRLLDLLINNSEASATTLAQHLPPNRQAAVKHLGVLDRTGLARATHHGREVRYRIEADQISRAAAAMAVVTCAWDARLNAIKRIAETIQHERGEPA